MEMTIQEYVFKYNLGHTKLRYPRYDEFADDIKNDLVFMIEQERFSNVRQQGKSYISLEKLNKYINEIKEKFNTLLDNEGEYDKFWKFIYASRIANLKSYYCGIEINEKTEQFNREKRDREERQRREREQKSRDETNRDWFHNFEENQRRQEQEKRDSEGSRYKNSHRQWSGKKYGFEDFFDEDFFRNFFGGGYRRERHNNYNPDDNTSERFFSSHSSAFVFMELSDTATQSEISRKFKKLSLKYHPDKGGTADNFRKLTSAKEMCISYAQSKGR